MKRLTDLQIKHQQQGRARIREAAKEARTILNYPGRILPRFNNLIGTVFTALPLKPWYLTAYKMPFDYTII